MNIVPNIAEGTTVAQAFEKAARLCTELGDDHPRTVAAAIEALELAEPGAMDRLMRESGIELPKATHCDDSGRPVYSVPEIAAALGEPEEAIQRRADALADQLSQAQHPHRLQ